MALRLGYERSERFAQQPSLLLFVIRYGAIELHGAHSLGGDFRMYIGNNVFHCFAEPQADILR